MKFPVQFTTRLEPKESFHFFFYGTLFRTVFFVPFLLIVGFALAFYTVYTTGIRDPFVYLSFWVFYTPLLSLGILFNVWRMSSRAKNKKGEPLFYQPIRMMLYPNRLRISYQGKNPYNLPFDRITRPLETKKYFILFVAKNVLFIRKQDVPNQETNEFLRKTLKPRKLYFGH